MFIMGEHSGRTFFFPKVRHNNNYHLLIFYLASRGCCGECGVCGECGKGEKRWCLCLCWWCWWSSQGSRGKDRYCVECSLL